VERRPRRPITHGRAVWVAALVLVLTLVPALVAGAAVDDTSVVSLATDGTPADGPSGPGVVVSPSGRHVVFESTADNLSDADDDSVVNLYLHDRETGETTLVSRASGVSGAGADADSTNAAISPGGARYVAFESRAANLSTVDGDPTLDVFVRDLETNTTTLVSRAPDGSPADGDSGNPALSQKAAKIVFESHATNLSDTDLDATTDVFMNDVAAGTTTLVSATGTGAGGDDSSFDPTISNDGTRIAFASDADNLRPDDDDTVTNIFLAQPRFRLMTPISRDTTSGVVDHPGDGDSFQPVISATGARVAFTSRAGNLTDESIATPSIVDVFVREVSAKKTTLVSRADGVGGAPGFADSHSPSISDDGRLVAFTSSAGNLSTADGPGTDVFVRDTAWGNTVLMSRASGVEGVTGQGDSSAPALARAGNLIAFVSAVDELTADPGDIQQPTVFARELLWPAPPVYVPPPDDGGHHGGGDGGHGGTDGHMGTDGHAADGHGTTADGHGHAAGGAHFTLKVGGAAADRLFGTPLHDKLCGNAGDDTISLSGGPDVGYGGVCGPVEPPTATTASWWRRAGYRAAASPTTPAAVVVSDGNDKLSGGKGDDALYGGSGNDRLVGGSGADYLAGGSGRDRLVGGPGRNRIVGGGGNDSINSANGVREMVDCGFGRDSVKADRRDILSGCERVRRVRRTSKKEPIELLPECPGGGHDCHNGSDTVVLSKASRAG
jgi:Tol biopolymer transport system component